MKARKPIVLSYKKLRLERLETRRMLAADFAPLDDVYTLDPDTPLEVSMDGGVLVNEALKNQTAELVESSAHGELTFRADGSFTYTAGESFPGIDTFTYRIADSTAEANLATVTLGLAESLDDIVKFRVEVVDLDGNPVASAPVGALLELRVFVQDVPDQTNVGPVFAGYAIRGEGAGAEIIERWRGYIDGYYWDGYYWFTSRNPAGGSDLDFGSRVVSAALRGSSAAAFEPGEQLIARTLFTASQAGTLSLAAERVVDPDKYGLWPVHLGDDTAESLRDNLQFVSYGQIDFGDAVSIEVLASDNTPPVVESEIYQVGETGVLEVDAAAGVLANDTDPDGDTLTARLFGEPRYGQVTLNADGSFRYVQESNGNSGSRLEQFSYVVDDGVSARIGRVILALPSGVLVPASWQNRANPIDVDGDGVFTSDDEWLLVHDLETNGERELPPPTSIDGPPPFLDVNGDGAVSYADVEAMYSKFVAFRLQPVSLDGSPLDQVTVGESFAVEVRVEDLRDDPRGVFAAYLDVEYDSSLVSLDGDLEFGDIYINDISGDTSVAGLIDEAGAFSDSKQPLGGGEFTVFTARFTATAAGEVVFSGNPADETPARDVNAYGWDITVPNSWIVIDSAALTVIAASDFASDDSVVVEQGASAATLDLLDNDEAALIVAVTNGSEGGEVSISADGLRVDYTPPSAEFIGAETFQYTAQRAQGATDVAIVTVHVRSRFQNPKNPHDTDGDDHISPLDALFGVNQLNEKGPRTLTDDDMVIAGRRRYIDVNGDGTHSPVDVLAVINQLNAKTPDAVEGEFAKMDAGVAVDAFQPAFASRATGIAAAAQPSFNLRATAPSATENETEASRNPHQERFFPPSDNATLLYFGGELGLLEETTDTDSNLLELEDVLQQIVPDIAGHL